MYKLNSMKFTPFTKEPTLENWFSIWLDELKEAGYVEDYSTGKEVFRFTLTEPVVVLEEEHRILYKGTKREKAVVRLHERVLLQKSTYKADFHITWDKKSEGIFYTTDLIEFTKGIIPFYAHEICVGSENAVFSWTDVKSPYKGKNCSDSTFPINRKIVWDKYKIFINKTIPMPYKKTKKLKDYLFTNTFTPERYLYTDVKLRLKSIKNWKPRKLMEFLNK